MSHKLLCTFCNHASLISFRSQITFVWKVSKLLIAQSWNQTFVDMETFIQGNCWNCCSSPSQATWNYDYPLNFHQRNCVKRLLEALFLQTLTGNWNSSSRSGLCGWSGAFQPLCHGVSDHGSGAVPTSWPSTCRSEHWLQQSPRIKHSLEPQHYSVSSASSHRQPPLARSLKEQTALKRIWRHKCHLLICHFSPPLFFLGNQLWYITWILIPN